MADALASPETGLSAHERRRWLLWLTVCEHRAVVPWVRKVRRLAQAAEDAEAYRNAQAVLTRLEAAITALDTQLLDLDPAWAEATLEKFYGWRPDGTTDWTRRVL